MNKKTIAVAALSFLCLGSVAAHAQGVDDYSRTVGPAVSPYATQAVGTGDLSFDPLTPDASALPGRGELPVPANLRNNQTARRYTGIIKNETRYEVSVPSESSDATLLIPPNGGWIEYTIWTRSANVTAYREGKPVYCLNLWADPSEFSFQCKKYDFKVAIPEPVGEPEGKYKPMKKRQRRVKKQPQV